MGYVPQELEGLTEGQSPPGEHECERELVSAVISRRRLILICYQCNTFWHTARLMKPTKSSSHSEVALLRAANRLYSVNKNERHRMRRAARDEETEHMFRHYYCRRGFSLAEIGDLYGMSRQGVYERFKHRGYDLRSRELKPQTTFNGETYSLSGKGGFYRKTTGDRSLLHRDKWEYFNGSISDGYQIMHIDGDPENNELDNLELVEVEAFLAGHRAPATDISDPRYCHRCGARLRRKVYPSGTREYPSVFAKRKYCDLDCFWDHQREMGEDVA